MISALLIGLFGSLHCVGMCGPLMFAVTGKQRSAAASILYHSGRLAVYALVGLFFGLLSTSVQFFNFQQYFSILLGVAILIIFAFPRIRNQFEGFYYQSNFYRRLKKRLTGYYSTRFKWLAAGMLNGALPCGMVYLAAAGAMISGGIFSSLGYMLIFGLGTLPLLVGVNLLRSKSVTHSFRLTNLTTAIAMLSGVILIARGILIDSPDLNDLLKMQIMNVTAACGF